MKLNKAVITAAGLGTRLDPLTSYLPKAMLPLGSKPVIQHVVEELQQLNIDDIIIVIRSEYEMIRNYFHAWNDVSFVIDDSRSGPGGAILKARAKINNQPFLAVFADAPIFGKKSLKKAYLMRLTESAEKINTEASVSIYSISADEVQSRGIVILKEKSNMSDSVIDINRDAVVIEKMLEKPDLKEVKGNHYWASACRYLLKPSIFKALESVNTDHNGELQLTTAIQQLINNGGKIKGLPLPNGLKRHDTGNFEGYFEAFREFTRRQ